MIPTASSSINTLTANFPVSLEERGVLTKTLKYTINLKIKLTKIAAKTILLKKLATKVIGVNEVEEYVKKEVKRGNKTESRRKELVKLLMRSKVKSAKEMEEQTRRRVQKMEDNIKRRWGHHVAAITDFLLRRAVSLPLQEICNRHAHQQANHSSKPPTCCSNSDLKQYEG